MEQSNDNYTLKQGFSPSDKPKQVLVTLIAECEKRIDSIEAIIKMSLDDHSMINQNADIFERIRVETEFMLNVLNRAKTYLASRAELGLSSDADLEGYMHTLFDECLKPIHSIDGTAKLLLEHWEDAAKFMQLWEGIPDLARYLIDMLHDARSRLD